MSLRIPAAWKAELQVYADEYKALHPGNVPNTSFLLRTAIRIGLDEIAARRKARS